MYSLTKKRDRRKVREEKSQPEPNHWSNHHMHDTVRKTMREASNFAQEDVV